ncbi:MAG TPA: formate dehydrogenase accessory sulfurtransferase FdhD [Woeseiaceae bacterium]|nr:formate dehydrogenase accessory sulfurtransferase FdhD [Woeseiaceae bacterium]
METADEMANSLAIDISKVSGDGQVARQDEVAVEEPLELQLVTGDASGAAAKSVSITMRTPGHDAELALGFLFSEGIITNETWIASIEPVGEPDPETGVCNIIRIGLNADEAIDFDRLERHFYTTSSCGVCGKASLDALHVAGQQSLKHAGTRFPRDVLTAMPKRLEQRQQVFSRTGGLHAAAVFSPDGEIAVVREDVGRHNAVDKAVGALLRRHRLPAHDLGLLVSGRASFELMQKALVAGLPLLAAVGAPSSLAVQLAREFDMTLVGFLRRDGFNVYAGSERLT